MIKITVAIKEIIEDSPILKFGLAYKLFNLTQLAKMISPQIKARTKKEVKDTAILMNLSRLQRQLNIVAPQTQSIKIDKITIRSSLCCLTFQKTAQIHKKLLKLKEYITLTEGTNETTIIIKEDFYEKTKQTIGEEAINEHKNIASIGLQFSEKFNNTPGFIHLILQQISLQHINLIEIASTHTELFLYIDQKDIKLAFDTLAYGFEYAM